MGIVESLVSHLKEFGLYPESENLAKDLQEVE